jgi:hypothetical protein
MADWDAPDGGEFMDPASKYHELALECLDLAVGTRDLETREQMIRLAELWARLADRAEDRKKELAPSDAA